MRTTLAWFAVGFCALSAGCRLAVNAARNLAYEPMCYADDVLECSRNARLARAAWGRVNESNPGEHFSTDHARGFEDGYADYLRNRGIGAPPPVPPKCYWNAHYQTPAGHSAIEDWYAGFAHGAAAARESDRAPFLTVPTRREGIEPPQSRPPAFVEYAPPAPAAEPNLPRPRPTRDAESPQEPGLLKNP